MATPEVPPKSEVIVPITEQAAPATEQEQQIDPWSVDAGQDSQGNALAFDYLAISKYARCKLSDRCYFC